MRKLIACFFAILLISTVRPVAAFEGQFATSDRLMEWVDTYRNSPRPFLMPDAARAMRRLGLLREQEKASFFTGFIAGVLGDNPKQARALVEQLFPMPAKEQAVIINAIAYSGLPDWQTILREFAPRMPHRKALVDDYLTGEAKPLLEVPLETGPGVLYALWGYYVATGYYVPVLRVIEALRWGEVRNQERPSILARAKSAFSWSKGPDINQMMIGATAKWTLASYAERNRELLAFYRSQLEMQPPDITPVLEEAIAAGEAFEADRIRVEELEVVEDAKRQEILAERRPSKATTAGSVALATGCVIATASGLPEIGLLCIITGALYNGAVKMWQSGK
jgi:hypothetical protein